MTGVQTCTLPISTYDTNGIVVREAAACSCPSLLVKDSCASEGIINEDTGIIIDETVTALGEAIQSAALDHERLQVIGKSASEKLYLSWDDAVGKAVARYSDVLKKQLMNQKDA